MECPECHTENPETRKFCRECGNKLLLICPDCSSENIPGDKFCGECGYNLIQSKDTTKELSFNEKLDKIQRYLPAGITDKILSQRGKIEGERKHVTVMFCDLEGFTQLVEQLGAEKSYNIMDQIYELLIHKVHDYEGTINEMTGDGIMALFGAPIALENASQRAIRSAYAIHREMGKFSNKLGQGRKSFSPLKMRIGIHSGPVVVGTLGNNLRVEFKAVGDTVNLASRMESLAQPGATYVTEDTFKLTEGFFRFEALGEKRIKGKVERVNVYRVIAPSTRRTRFDVSAERGLTPFVGRKRELELLIDGFERSKQGYGQVYSIISEAGVGKSRLLYEFSKAIANEDVMFLEGKCLSYSRNVAYHPIIDVLKSIFGIQEGDDDSETKKKLKHGLSIFDVDEAVALSYFLELFSVKDSGVDEISLSPEAIKEQIIGTLNRIAVKASNNRPLIMAFEDLHWIDKSSEAAFKSLLDNIAGARIFLIFTYRPEYSHSWGTRSYHSQITLNRLPNRESLAMVSDLLKSEVIEKDLENLILHKTEGVPFFIEESIKFFKDLKVIERKDDSYKLAKNITAISIPSTIQDVIMARVDNLPLQAKEVLQIGSVIEREFSYELIKQVSEVPEQELFSLLAILKDAEFLYERGIDQNKTFIFKHALTQEVVYDSILTPKKKELHNQVGHILENVYSSNLQEYYGILAEHFMKSENFENGVKYCKLAGQKAHKTGSFDDAIGFGKKHIYCIENLSEAEDAEKILINARIKLGLYYIHLAQHSDAKAAIDPIIGLVISQKYKRELSLVYGMIGHYQHFVKEDYPKALEYLNKALEIGEDINDILSLAMTYLYLGLCLSMNLDYKKAIKYLHKALTINEAANVTWGIAAIKSQIVFDILLPQGKIEEAYKISNEALKLANESGDVHSRAHAYLAHGWYYYNKGYWQKAKTHLLKAVEISERINQFGLIGAVHWVLGEIYFDIGEYKKSKSHFERVIEIFRYGKILNSWANAAKIAIARTRVMNKEEINLNEILKWNNDISNNWIKAILPNIIANILCNIDGEHDLTAEECIKDSINVNQLNGMVWHLAKDYALLATLYKRRGDKLAASETLSKSIMIFDQCGANGWAERYKKELAEF